MIIGCCGIPIREINPFILKEKDIFRCEIEYFNIQHNNTQTRFTSIEIFSDNIAKK